MFFPEPGEVLQPYQFEPNVEEDGGYVEHRHGHNIDTKGRLENSNWCHCGGRCVNQVGVILKNDAECICCSEFQKITVVRDFAECISVI